MYGNDSYNKGYHIQREFKNDHPTRNCKTLQPQNWRQDRLENRSERRKINNRGRANPTIIEKHRIYLAKALTFAVVAPFVIVLFDKLLNMDTRVSRVVFTAYVAILVILAAYDYKRYPLS